MSSKEIAVLDYGIGNLFSISKAVNKLGAECILLDNPLELERFDKAILPGVGAFDSCYAELRKKGFIDHILNFVNNDKKLMGICVGMQLMFSHSFEGKKTTGLNIIQGHIRKIKSEEKQPFFKLPHIGWKSIKFPNDNCSLFKGIENHSTFYFIHSYTAVEISENQDLRLGYSEYFGIPILAFVQKNNVVGCQFHPEKSGLNGLKLLKNFMDW